MIREPYSPCEIRTAERVGLSPDKVREVFEVLEIVLDQDGFWGSKTSRLNRTAQAAFLSEEKVQEVLDVFQEEFLKTSELSCERLESEASLRPEFIAQMNLYAKDKDA